MPVPNAADIRARFPDPYVAYHARRYARVLGLLADAGLAAPGKRVLDVGRSPLTELLADLTGGADSLGLDPDACFNTGRHFHFDLNLTQRREDWRTDLAGYDAIVMGEVIEHLLTAPGRVLTYLRSRLAPGGLLLLQTPNAAAFHKRLILLLGRQPFHRLCEDRSGSLHVREYTRRELEDYAHAVGLKVERVIMESPFDYRVAFDHHAQRHVRRRWGAMVNALYAVMPPGLRRGITMTLRHDGREPAGRPGVEGA